MLTVLLKISQPLEKRWHKAGEMLTTSSWWACLFLDCSPAKLEWWNRRLWNNWVGSATLAEHEKEMRLAVNSKLKQPLGMTSIFFLIPYWSDVSLTHLSMPYITETSSARRETGYLACNIYKSLLNSRHWCPVSVSPKETLEIYQKGFHRAASAFHDDMCASSRKRSDQCQRNAWLDWPPLLN